MKIFPPRFCIVKLSFSTLFSELINITRKFIMTRLISESLKYILFSPAITSSALTSTSSTSPPASHRSKLFHITTQNVQN